MRDALAERLLADVMSWSPEDVARERPRLQVMAAYKYDEYQQFKPGERFVESLALWLSQFEERDERLVAYDWVMQQLVFISDAELHHFIAMGYRDLVRPLLLREVAADLGKKPWELVAAEKSERFAAHRRRCLVLGLSDGARLDVFRRAAPELSNEQVWQTYQMPADRATSLLDNLEGDLAEFDGTLRLPTRFTTVLLLDDFAGSGMSFFRRDNGKTTGKLARFLEGARSAHSPLPRLLVSEGLHVIVLLYVATSRAISHISSELKALEGDDMRFTVRCVHSLGETLTVSRQNSSSFAKLLERYRPLGPIDEHMAVGGSDGVFGFGDCGLPLVLSHNTPNNSVALLWAQTPPRRALFPRISRHVSSTRPDDPRLTDSDA